MSFLEHLFAGSEILASTRWSAWCDVVCLLGLAGVVAAVLVHRRAALAGRALAGGERACARLPVLALFLGTLLMSVVVWMRGLEVNHFPSQTMSEVLQVFTLALLVSMVALHFALALPRRGPGWAILDDVLIGLVLAGVFFTHRHIDTLSTAQRDLPPALQSYWFPPHLSSLIFSYATMAVAAGIALFFFVTRFWTGVFAQSATARRLGWFVLGSGALTVGGAFALAGATSIPFVAALGFLGLPAGLVAYAALRCFAGAGESRTELWIALGLALVPFVQVVTLPLLVLSGLVFCVLRWRGRLPELARMAALEKELDDVSFRAFAVGIPFLTAGLWMGAFWAQEAWANYWGWDSKENAALITWLVYIIYVHLRMLGGYRGAKAMGVLVAGAFSVFVTFQLFGYFPDSQKSLHRYTDDNVRPMEGQQGSGQQGGASGTEQAQRAESDAR